MCSFMAESSFPRAGLKIYAAATWCGVSISESESRQTTNSTCNFRFRALKVGWRIGSEFGTGTRPADVRAAATPSGIGGAADTFSALLPLRVLTDTVEKCDLCTD